MPRIRRRRGARPSSLVIEMMKLINKVWRDDRGVSALEYAMLAAVVVAALAGLGTVFGTDTSSGIGKVFNNIMTTITNKTSSTS